VPKAQKLIQFQVKLSLKKINGLRKPKISYKTFEC